MLDRSFGYIRVSAIFENHVFWRSDGLASPDVFEHFLVARSPYRHEFIIQQT